MILDNPARSLRLVLGEAHTTTACDIVACYGQQSPAGAFITSLSQTASTGTTPVTVVAAPLIGSQNLVQEVRLHNADTVTHTVTLQLLDVATTRTVYSGTVLSGADWVYTPGAGSNTTSVTVPVASATTPVMDGVGTPGVSAAWSRGDHQHPVDTSRAPTASPTFTGTVTAGATNVGAFTATGITASPISGSTGSFTTLAASSTVSGTGFSTYLASPPAIGGSSAAAGSFTTLAASSTVSGTGFSTYLASPPAIGGSAAAAGAFTTLSASSTVSGAGFSTYLASPPAIGGSAAAAGKFTTLQATGLITPAATIGIVGTTTNNDAQAGSIGEYISATVLSGSAISLTTTTPTNITSISLTAGDWDVSGDSVFSIGATTTITQFQSCINTTSATLPTTPPFARANRNISSFAPGTSSEYIPTGVIRMSLSGTTTVYLIAQANFGVSTMTAWGFIAARRVR